MAGSLSSISLNMGCPYAYTDEILDVKQRAARLRWKSISVMIGCGPAVFGLALMESLNDPTELWIVDKDPNMFGYAEQHFGAADLHTGVMDRVHFVEGDSAQIGQEWQSEIDFLLVDGDHSYEGVRADLDAWLPHVKRRGTVWFHDYLERPGGFDGSGRWEEGGCARAVAEAISDGRLMSVKRVGISIVCERL